MSDEKIPKSKRDFCEACSRVFEHPGHYEHLMTAGWRPAYVRVYRHRESDHMPESAAAFSRSGWLCPQHASVLPDDLPGEPNQPGEPNPALLPPLKCSFCDARVRSSVRLPKGWMILLAQKAQHGPAEVICLCPEHGKQIVNTWPL